MTSVPPPGYTHPGPPPDFPERPAGAPVRAAARDGLPPWRPWTSGAALAAGLALPLGFGVIVGLAIAVGGGEVDDDLPPGVLLGLTVVQDLGFIAAALLFARLARPPRPADFGILRPRLWMAIGLTIAVYIGVSVFAAVWIGVLDIDARDEIVRDLGAEDSTAALAALLVVVCVLAPLAEEVLFRGYIFTALRNWKGMWPAAVITGLVFGGIHVGSSPVGFLVPLAIFGFGLCLLYAWTRSLYPCVALHAINNSFAFGNLDEVGWTWQIAPLVVGATVVSMGLLWLIGQALGRLRATPAPAPA